MFFSFGRPLTSKVISFENSTKFGVCEPIEALELTDQPTREIVLQSPEFNVDEVIKEVLLVKKMTNNKAR